MKNIVNRGGLKRWLVLLIVMWNVALPTAHSVPLKTSPQTAPPDLSVAQATEPESWQVFADSWSCTLTATLRTDLDAVFENAIDHYSGDGHVHCYNPQQSEHVEFLVTIQFQPPHMVSPEPPQISVNLESMIQILSGTVLPLFGSFHIQRFQDSFASLPNTNSVQLSVVSSDNKNEVAILGMAVTWAHTVAELNRVFAEGTMTITPHLESEAQLASSR